MLFLRTLGTLALEDGGRPIGGAAAQRSRLAILAALAVAGERGMSRDRLLALFWPESDSERARGALKQAIYALRRDAPDQDITLGTNELRLNPDIIQSDVGEFDAAFESGDLARAVELYVAPFLDGVHLRAAPDFERWLDRERERLAGQYRKALERLARSAEASGDRTAAVHWWKKLADADPLSASVAAALMNALATAGDGPAALQHARVHAALVREELDAAPDPAVVELEQRIRASAAAASLSSNGSLVQTSAAHRLETSIAQAPAVQSATTDVLPPTRFTARRPRLVYATAAITVVSLAVVLAYFTWPRAGEEVVVVPPFQNETGDPAFDAFGRMAAAWVTEGLARTNLVRVVDFRTALRGAQPASQAARASSESPIRLAGRTGATTIVYGGIYRAGDRITVQTRIIRGRDGSVLYEGDPVEGPGADPRSLLEAVRQRVIGAFAAFSNSRFTPWAHAVSQPPRYDAYLEFLSGLEHLARFRTEQAFPHFLAASRLDTTFLQAKLYAIESDPGAPVTSTAFRDSLLEVAVAQRERLTAYDRASLDRHLAGARRSWEGMYEASQRMLQLAPQSPEAVFAFAGDAINTNHFRAALKAVHSLGADRGWLTDGNLFFQRDIDAHHFSADFEGELAEVARFQAAGNTGFRFCFRSAIALAALGRQASVDSLIPECLAQPDALVPGSAWLNAGLEFRSHGHHDAARRALLRARQWYAAQDTSWTRGGVFVGIDSNLSDWKAVVKDLQDIQALRPLTVREYTQWAVAAAHLGDLETARAMAGQVARLGNPPIDAALIAAALEGREKAMQLVRAAIDSGVVPVRQFHRQPLFDPLRGYPPFDALFKPRR